MSDAAAPERSTADAFRAANLQQRVITAVIIGIAFLALVLLSSPPWFAILSGAVFLIAAWEWSDLAGWSGKSSRASMVVCLVLLSLAWYFFPQYLAKQMDLGFFFGISWLLNTLYVTLLFWFFALVVIIYYPTSAAIISNPWINSLFGIFLLLPTWTSLNIIKSERPYGALILLVVAMIAMADIGAYFAGVRFGKHKLAPQVSPGKSWEGVAGGVLFNILFVAGLGYYFGWTKTQGSKLALVAIAVTAASIVGDLFESMIKRQRGVKDSGTILPGHGGILDRIDGWMAAVPVFTLLYLFGCTGLP